MADKAASVLAKLKNKARASGISYQQCLQLFMQEEFLRKLSKSGYADFLVLKGGLFIYTLTNFESRATIDVDFLLRGFSNSMEDVKDLVGKIIETPTGRMKDFYDIYYLARTFDFEGAKLQTAIFETLQQRGTSYGGDSFKRIVALAEDEDMQKRWRYFLKNIKDDTLEFVAVIEEMKIFLGPVFEAIVNEGKWCGNWYVKNNCWIK